MGGEKNAIDSGEGDDVVVSVGKLNVISTGDGNDLVFAKGQSNIISTGDGVDAVVSLGQKNTIKGGKGINLFLSGGKDNVFEGGSGKNTFVLAGENNQFKGGSGDDTYVLADDLLNSATDTVTEKTSVSIDNQGDDSTTDILLFGGDIEETDIRFAQLEDDLLVSVFDSNQQITVQNWYTNADERIDTFQISQGSSLSNSQVEQLVDSWQQFDSNLITQSELTTAINNVWVA